jgi:hypothetical protein
MDEPVNGPSDRQQEVAIAQTIGREIARLRRVTPSELRERYAEVFDEPTRSDNKQLMAKRIA